MRNFLLSLIFFLTAQTVCFAIPQKMYDEICGKGQICQPTYIDISRSTEYKRQLEEAFDKKYIVKRTKDGVIYNYPDDAYRKEVSIPFAQFNPPEENFSY